MNYFSPIILIFSSMEGIVSASFVIWTALFVTSLFVGRTFCSYLCPYGGMQMAYDKASPIAFRYVRWLMPARYILGTVWVLFILYAVIRSGGLGKLEIFYNTENIVSLDNVSGVIRYYMILGAAFLFVHVMGRRSFCKYLCPMAILNTLGTRIKNYLKLPSLKMTVNADQCSQCKKCDQVCPMTLKVSDMVKQGQLIHDDCILCGECQAACHKQAIKRAFF
jgi:polyferredoxin